MWFALVNVINFVATINVHQIYYAEFGLITKSNQFGYWSLINLIKIWCYDPSR
jgi:hypothetical protein